MRTAFSGDLSLRMAKRTFSWVGFLLLVIICGCLGCDENMGEAPSDSAKSEDGKVDSSKDAGDDTRSLLDSSDRVQPNADGGDDAGGSI